MDKNLLLICAKVFKLNKRSITNGFRDYLDCRGKDCPVTLKPLEDCLKTLPCSTAECERGFSIMNNILTDLRSSLSIKHVESLMFIKLNGTPLAQFQALPYVKSWLFHHRSASETQSRHADIESVTGTLYQEIWSLF